MFDRRCREVRVMDEIGPNARQRKQLAEQLRMPVHRMRIPYGVAPKPRRNAPTRDSIHGRGPDLSEFSFWENSERGGREVARRVPETLRGW